MRKQLWGTAVLAAGISSQAAAVNVENYRVPYFGLGYDHLITDSAREAGDGAGFQLTFGVPMDSERSAIELRFFDAAIDDRFPDGDKDYQTGMMVDYVYDFGAVLGGGDSFSGLKPFITAGAGFIQEDVLADKHMHLAANLGAGVLVPVGWKGWALRLDARVQPQSNNESVSQDKGFPDDKSVLVDYVVNLGLQIPMTLFFDRPVAVKEEADCPVAVVNATTGRRDCAVDSDRDGVDDTADECPGTSAGTAVDAKGCARAKAAAADADADGVEDEDDDCPGTPKGLKVNDDGCVVAQKTSLAGVTFQPNSAKLTAEGRATLDAVAETLERQQDLKVEIAGHTDSVGSDAYNTLLSQQRADAVRTYLTGKGLDGDGPRRCRAPPPCRPPSPSYTGAGCRWRPAPAYRR
jgi:outer membrane protein OmpA-like peptidoglycan-associated protein